MKKTILSVLIMLSLALGGMLSANAEQKIATIDIQKIIDSSAQIQALNKEQEVKIQELEKWVESVKKDIEKQQTQENKEKLFKKYRDTYLTKKADIIKTSQTKVQAFMNEVSSAIESTAKAKGYDMIIAKGVVIYGGDDITEDVQNALKTKKVTTAQPKAKK